MPNKENLKEEITTAQFLETLVTTYEEIAVMRIQKVRTSVLSTRSFHEGLSRVYSNVKASHENKVSTILKKKNKSNKKDIKKGVVLISTDQYLSGSITSAVFKEFLKFIDTHPHEIIITGHIGKDRLTQARPKKQVSYFDLPNQLNSDTLQELVTHLQQYDELIVFHGQFINLVKQTPAEVDLTGAPADAAVKKFKQTHADAEFFLFEPSLDEVVDFFDTRIFAILFKQMAYEANLAQLGSRITAMETASTNIKKKITELTLQQRQIVRAEANDKQRQRLAGIALWS